MQDQKPEVRDELGEKLDLDDSLTEAIEASLAEFKTQYESGAQMATTPSPVRETVTV